MARDRGRKTPPDAPYQPAWRLYRRFGISYFRLMGLAKRNVIREQETTTVFKTFSVEDVERYVQSLGPHAPTPPAKEVGAIASAK